VGSQVHLALTGKAAAEAVWLGNPVFADMQKFLYGLLMFNIVYIS
jgi:hypothetical protein